MFLWMAGLAFLLGVSFIFMSLFVFNEEFIFFVIFIVFIYIVYKYYGLQISVSLNNYSNSYNYDLVRLISLYGLRIYVFFEHILDLSELEANVIKIYSYFFFVFEESSNMWFVEFNKFFYIFKDWVLKLVVQEVLEFIRQLYYKYFLLYRHFIFDLININKMFYFDFMFEKGVDNDFVLLNTRILALDFLLFEEVDDFELVENVCDYFSLMLINNVHSANEVEN